MFSTLYINSVSVYNETVTQQWRVSIADKINDGLFITVEILCSPQTNSPAIQPLYVLTNIINKAIACVRLKFDFNGNVTVENQKEISTAWEECKKEIIEDFGKDNEILNKMMKDADYNFYNFTSEVNKSLLYFILLSAFKDEKEIEITTSSILDIGHNVILMMKRTNSEKMDNGDVHYFQRGESTRILFSNYESIYNKQVRSLAGDALFDYKYTFETEHIFRHKKLFDKAIAIITEQASANYIYTNHVELKLVEAKICRNI